jgi:formylglycine-generating enzyme required for sulfatase activity
VQQVILVLALLAIPAAAYYWQVQSARHQAELDRKEAEIRRRDAEIERVKGESAAKAAEADRLLAQAANARGAERDRLEKEAARAQAESDKLAASAKDYETLSQKRDSELAQLRTNRDDLARNLKKAQEDNKTAKEDNGRLLSEKTGLEKKLADAERERSELARRLEVAEKEKDTLAAKPAAGQPSPGPMKTNPRDGLVYVWIPPGKFSMGCSPGDKECDGNEKPAREVTITKGFWMGQTEVTQAAYQKVIGRNPSRFKGRNLPGELVSWTDAVRYCTAVGGRLPTEAEWEYAARAGTSAAYYGELDEIAWHNGNSEARSHEVRGKQPNAFGLSDMLGNVQEWTADLYGPYQGAQGVDPKGPSSGTDRVLRGGSYHYGPTSMRVSDRWGTSNWASFEAGFRCVGEIP